MLLHYETLDPLVRSGALAIINGKSNRGLRTVYLFVLEREREKKKQRRRVQQAPIEAAARQAAAIH